MLVWNKIFDCSSSSSFLNLKEGEIKGGFLIWFTLNWKNPAQRSRTAPKLQTQTQTKQNKHKHNIINIFKLSKDYSAQIGLQLS